ncbi:helix-turn-helix transcriptional regulator [Paenibacillus terrigena]|uniref:helix-turn-helix transcriptional regulator n=1 Tax=Paenibacillus terrigena TaxID=369333 RepID=UPI00036020BD|nr:AraC family transcriptional regulator [Paenibacillus terrigena]
MSQNMQLQEPIELMYRNSLPIDGVFHSHAFYEVYYFHTGECTYLIGDKIMTLASGDLILMHGMTLHCPNPVPHVPYVRTIIHFDPSYLTTVLQPNKAAELLRPFEELSNIRLHLNERDQEEFNRLLTEMNDLYRHRRDPVVHAAYDRFSLRFMELMHFVGGLCSKHVYEREHRSEKERYVQRVISFLEDHYAEEITLEAIASSLHLSKPYLSNLFKEVTGTTVFKYLYNRRINQAKIWLRLKPSYSVSDIGRMVGFRHLAHFSRLFKAVAGCSPEAYRKGIWQESSSHRE